MNPMLNAAMQDSGLTPEMLPEDMMGTAIEVEMEGMPEEITIDPMTGEITVEMETEDEGETEIEDFMANLAEVVPEDELEKLGAELVELVDKDVESRKPWYDRMKRGLENLGIYDVEEQEDSEQVSGINRITHPLLLEAGTQFQARAMAELFPPSGPVKCAIIGPWTQEKFDQARRVEVHMNWQLMVDDRAYMEENDQKYYYLPFTGSEFDKQYNDPVSGKNVSRWVKSVDLVVPYDATSLETAERITHIIPITKNRLRKLQAAKFYRAVDMDETVADESGRSEVTEQIKKMDGLVQVAEEDAAKSYTFFEIHVELDLVGFERDVPLPYIVTVDKGSKQVMSIYRNWREEDERYQKRCWFTHKKFLPGFGFYGYGLLHTIGGLSEAATKILNILLDAGAYASLQGGFKSKDAKLKGDIEITPGEWIDTEMTAEELAKAFYTPPFKEPSMTLFKLLEAIQMLGQRFAATTEVMVGEAATTGPVGTTVAQIEQASKVFSGVHKRLHRAVGDELLHLAELNFEHLDDVYPFDVAGGDRHVLKEDYDGRIDIIPVSDPNIFSSAQRIAQAQATLQLAQTMPDVANRREAGRALLQAMRVPDYERVIPEPAEAPYTDPITEGALALVGRPIRAFPEQNHTAHVAVHQMQYGQMQQIGPQGPQIAATMMAHIQEHIAQQALVEAQMNGIMLAPMNWGAEPSEDMAMSIPAEIENQIAAQAAQMAQKIMQQQQQAQQAQEQAGQPNPQVEMAKIQQDGQLRQAEMQQKGQLKQAEMQQDGQLKQAELAQKSQIAQAEMQMEERLKRMELEMERMRIAAEDQRKRAEAAATIQQRREAEALKPTPEKGKTRK